MAEKWMYIQNDNTQKYPFCRSKLVAETFKHSTQSIKIHLSTQSCQANEWEYVIIKLWVLV